VPSVGAASSVSSRASPALESSFSGDPRRLIRAATQAPSSRSASGANRTRRPLSASAAGRGTRSLHATGRSLSGPSGFHAQGVTAVATDDLDSLEVERMDGQSDRRDRPLPSTSVRGHVAVLGWAFVVRLVLVCLVFRECLDHGVPRMPNCEGRQCCGRDEGRPFGVGVQDQAPNPLTRRWSRASVVAGEGKGAPERVR
jgi:hypothetical protein